MAGRKKTCERKDAAREKLATSAQQEEEAENKQQRHQRQRLLSNSAGTTGGFGVGRRITSATITNASFFFAATVHSFVLFSAVVVGFVVFVASIGGDFFLRLFGTLRLKTIAFFTDHVRRTLNTSTGIGDTLSKATDLSLLAFNLVTTIVSTLTRSRVATLAFGTFDSGTGIIHTLTIAANLTFATSQTTTDFDTLTFATEFAITTSRGTTANGFVCLTLITGSTISRTAISRAIVTGAGIDNTTISNTTIGKAVVTASCVRGAAIRGAAIGRRFGAGFGGWLFANAVFVGQTITVVVFAITDLFARLNHFCRTGNTATVGFADVFSAGLASPLSEGTGLAFVAEIFVNAAIAIVVFAVTKFFLRLNCSGLTITAAAIGFTNELSAAFALAFSCGARSIFVWKVLIDLTIAIVVLTVTELFGRIACFSVAACSFFRVTDPFASGFTLPLTSRTDTGFALNAGNLSHFVLILASRAGKTGGLTGFWLVCTNFTSRFFTAGAGGARRTDLLTSTSRGSSSGGVVTLGHCRAFSVCPAFAIVLLAATGCFFAIVAVVTSAGLARCFALGFGIGTSRTGRTRRAF
jgi:hypothetical protein